MTIKEWLTPGLFDINVILVALMINWTLFSLASNFLEDFHIPDRVQNSNYTAVVLMSLAYGLLVLLGFIGVVKPQPTLYPNEYDFLLMGNYQALGCIIFGLAAGGPLGWVLGGRNKLRWATLVAALACEGLIGLGVLLWILNQK
jgi:hypothetical protein